MFRILPMLRRHDDSSNAEETRKLEGILGSEAGKAASVDSETASRRQLLFNELDRREEEGSASRATRLPVPADGQVAGSGWMPSAGPIRNRKLLPGGWTEFFPRPAFVAAIGLVVVLSMAALFWLRQAQILDYETGRGQQSLVTLADSTQVSLNHTSKLTVTRRPFENTRDVTLTGEAFFQVRKNGMPFTVQTEAGTVRVLGTEFNVRVRERNLEVAVVRGRVSVTSHREGRDSTVVIGAGEIVTCPQGSFPNAPAPLPFAGYPGWQNGQLFFYRTELAAACREIEAKFDVSVQIERNYLEQPVVPAQGRPSTITGRVDGRSVDAALRALALLTGKQYLHENGSYILR